MSSQAAKPVQDLTLGDLLGDTELQAVFRGTFAVVRLHASMADANKAMKAVPACRDVFVTQNGERDEPVVGWVTNVDMLA